MRLALLASATLLLACQAAPDPAATTVPAAPGKTSWSVKANLVESCCCDPICPCMVGSQPTRGYCIGNRLVEITEGEYGGVRLDGVALVLTFRLREWSKLYFAEDTTAEEVAAARALLGEVWSGLLADVLEVERVPLEVERTSSTVAYSVPAATTRIEVMRGADDQPIRVENLSSFRDYVQYVSVETVHEAADEDQAFTLSGTNGFTATFEASSAH